MHACQRKHLLADLHVEQRRGEKKMINACLPTLACHPVPSWAKPCRIDTEGRRGQLFCMCATSLP